MGAFYEDQRDQLFEAMSSSALVEMLPRDIRDAVCQNPDTTGGSEI